MNIALITERQDQESEGAFSSERSEDRIPSDRLSRAIRQLADEAWRRGQVHFIKRLTLKGWLSIVGREQRLSD